ncbi:MAG: glycosyltransferase, partial [Rubrobacteridae bacterium]|nr:glycosyltransferase [Rubrobacteridae bacterium]
MQDRVDIELAVKIAHSIPEANFVFAGPVFTPHLFEPLKKLPNVVFTGRVHQSKIPAFINFFDVCIMPHVKDSLTAAMNPLKIYEYLALGKPVVCTDVGEIDQFDGLVETACDFEVFREKVLRFLNYAENHADSKSEPSLMKDARIEFAAGQSWSERVQCMVKEIDRKLIEKASSIEK